MALTFSTESLARASARHPLIVIGAWLAVLLASFGIIGALLASALTTEIALTNNPDSGKADQIVKELRGEDHANEVIIVQSADRTVDDQEFKAFTESLYGDISALGPKVIDGGVNYYLTGDATLVSRDRKTTIMPFVMAGNEVDAEDHIDSVLSVLERADGQGGFRVLTTGVASINHDAQKTAQKDLQTGEAIGIPIALFVLVIVFGALTAAVIPLVLGLISIVIAVGISALLGQVTPLSFFVTNVITMMGLAVGIDYSLFIVSRYREERNRGLEKQAAIAEAGRTASRAVLFSGMTVVFALCGMLLVPSTIFRSLGAGAIIVVLVSVLVTMTLLPAILGLLGDRVNSLKLPFIGRASIAQDHEAHGGFWDKTARLVMRFPVISLVASAAVLIALAVPYLDINTGTAGVSTLPHDLPSRQGYEILRQEFSFGLVTPVQIAIGGDVNDPATRAAIDDLKSGLAADGAFGPTKLDTNEAGNPALLETTVNSDFASQQAVDAVRRLRAEIVPAAFASTGTPVYVGGATGTNIDYFDTTDSYTPIVIAFVLSLSFVLLMIVFRSLIVPIKAIIMNLLSVGASYGVLVLVFQKGVGNEVFGLTQVDIIEAWVPLWTFSILFGLSMDYHVFLLSRIRERFMGAHDNTESVAFGVRSTAGLITGAALIMVAVFMGVAQGDMVMFQQMGFGLGVAVILDATIVRCILVPAAMKLLGDRNWYLPSWLGWLPQVSAEGSAREPATAVQPPAGTVEAS